MEHDDDRKTTASSLAAVFIFAGSFVVILRLQMESGVPWWWAFVVAFVFLRCAVALSKLDTKSLVLFTLLAATAAAVRHAAG